MHAYEPGSRRAVDGPRRSVRGPAERPAEGYLAGLQRQIGNQAVTALVQRAPRERPAPTDAPGAKKAPKKKGKPQAPEKKAADVRARVLGYSIDAGVGLITISAGTEQGVKAGMSASLTKADGTEYGDDFLIEKADGARSSAHVKATQDEVSANPYVLIKASKYREESQAGKEF